MTSSGVTTGSASTSIVHSPSRGDTQFQSISQAHFKQTYHEIKFLGEGDNGVTYAAVSKKNVASILARHRQQRSQSLYDEVRSNLVAVKFYKNHNVEGDLSKEIRFLTQHFTSSHPNLTGAIDSHLKGEIQWVALPFCSGGDLERFAADFPEALSLPFRWHVGLQLAKALMFLFFGVGSTDVGMTNPVPKWSRCYHHDLFEGNILLQPRNEPSFPRIVVADFGRAKSLQQLESRGVPDSEARIRKGQIVDVRSIAAVLGNLQCQGLRAEYGCCLCLLSPKDVSRVPENSQAGNVPGDEEVWVPKFDHRLCTTSYSIKPSDLGEEVFNEFKLRLLNFNATRSDIAETYAILENFIHVARTEAGRYAQYLPPQAAADLARIKVSDEELHLGIQTQ